MYNSSDLKNDFKDINFKNDFLYVSNKFIKKMTGEGRVSLMDYMSFSQENKNQILNMANLIKTKGYFKLKQELSEEFYKKILNDILDTCLFENGYKEEGDIYKRVEIDMEFRNFISLDEVKKEIIDNKNFKSLMNELLKFYCEEENVDVKKISDEIKLEIANLGKKKVFYNNKEDFNDDFYLSLIDEAKIEIQKKIIEAKIPLLTEKYISDKNVFSSEEFTQVKKAMSDAFLEAKELNGKGSSLGHENNFINKERNQEKEFIHPNFKKDKTNPYLR